MVKIKVPTYARILIGMVLGIITGFLAIEFNFASFITNWIAPFGTIFINLLKMVAVPLVFLSLIKGVTGLGEIRTLSKLGFRTIGLYICTTIIAISLGVGLVTLLRPGDIFPQEKALELREKYETVVSSHSENASLVSEQSPLQFLVDVVPENIVESLGSNSNMLQVIFLAFLVGVGMVAIGVEKLKPLADLVDSLNKVVLWMIDAIMMMAPLGVFGLMSSLAIDAAGDLMLFKALGAYALTVISALLILIFLFYPTLIHFFSSIKARHFIKTASPVQLLGFSTSSSAATLPLTMEQSQKELGLSPEVTSFVLPVGVTINMDGTSCYQAIATIFIAQVMGIDLSLSQILTVIAITTISSIGTPGIPGGSVVMLVMVLTSVGIPGEGLALILGIDRPLDMLRTSVNVTGDMAVASIIDKSYRRKSL